MIDLAVIGVAAVLPAVVGIDVARRAARKRAVRRGVDDYASWMLDDIWGAAQACGRSATLKARLSG